MFRGKENEGQEKADGQDPDFSPYPNETKQKEKDQRLKANGRIEELQ